eukprot:6739095-Prymnesium_polylepis.1
MCIRDRITHKLTPAEFRGALGFEPMVEQVKPSISHIYAFVGLEGTTESLGLHGANLWVLPVDSDYRFSGVGVDDGEGLDGGMNALAVDDTTLPPKVQDPWDGVGDDEEQDDLLMFMSFPSARDPSAATRFPGKSTACIITTAHPQTFARFYDVEAEGEKGRNQAGKRHNLDYDNIKHGLESKLLKGLYRHFPACKVRVLTSGCSGAPLSPIMVGDRRCPLVSRRCSGKGEARRYCDTAHKHVLSQPARFIRARAYTGALFGGAHQAAPTDQHPRPLRDRPRRRIRWHRRCIEWWHPYCARAAWLRR